VHGGDRDRAALQRLQQLLSLRDEDIAAIETPILPVKQTEDEQQQPAEREQAAQKQQEREQAHQRTQSVSPPPTPHSSSTITRQQFLKLIVFSGGGLAVALIGNEVIQSSNQGTSENPASPELLTSDFETVTVDDQGQIAEQVSAQAKSFQEDLGNSVTLEMIATPAGEFLMGAAANEQSASDRAMPQHCVKVPEFWMGKFAVTQAQWRQVAGLPKVKVDLNLDPSNFKGAKRPVETVSWEQAVEFCDRLSQKTGKTYRLPSEAEWEYACRARTVRLSAQVEATTPFYFGETITSDLVNCRGTNPYGNAPKGEYRQQTTEVGTFPPNGFGLYDMHGNVFEWCADPWHDNYQDAPTDGSVWTTNGNNERRVVRGGSWVSNPRGCRSAYRYCNAPVNTYNYGGFRVVCSAPRTFA